MLVLRCAVMLAIYGSSISVCVTGSHACERLSLASAELQLLMASGDISEYTGQAEHGRRRCVSSESRKIPLSCVAFAGMLAWRERDNLTVGEIVIFSNPSINEPRRVGESLAFLVYEARRYVISSL
jgi:hypothetical protein